MKLAYTAIILELAWRDIGDIPSRALRETRSP
jgi:hypothetical protein